MDIVDEVKKLVIIKEETKQNNEVLKTLNKDLNIYKYTYSECEIDGVGYLIAKNIEDAKIKIPYYNKNGFDHELYLVMSMKDLICLLADLKVEVLESDWDCNYGIDTTLNLLRVE